ncbi:hypothetical protein JCM10207_002080 [Rhodosporidiobolus poonsookiae]
MAAPTRLLFTALHPSVATSHLRDHLSRCPPSPPIVTDLKVVTRPGGQSRCIAFAGFKSNEDAERVRKWMSGAWVQGDKGGARCKVDWAKDTREAPARPTKRQKLSTPSSSSAAATGGPPAKADDRFSEFMALMAPRKPLLQNDETDAAASAGGLVASSSTSSSAAVPSPSAKRQKAAAPEAAPVPAPEEPEGEAAADGAAEDEGLTDAEYLARRMRRLAEPEKEVEDEEVEDAEGVVEAGKGEKAFEQPDEEGEAHEAAAPAEPTEADKARESLRETGRLFLRNLPFSTTQEELEEVFRPYGSLEQVHIPTDPSTKSSKGIAYVTYRKAEDAVAAFDALDGTTFQGRLLHLLPAVGRAAKERRGREGEQSLKEGRMEERKKNSGQAFNWGTLFLNADAALSAVADRLGVSKSSLLDPSASDPAVKVALAEAHTLSEIKRYFESEGVNLAAFGKPGPRSSTCILVKNLPFGTTAASLQALFSPYGATTRLLVPTSGTIAVVEFADADATSAAWRGLVYKQFGGSVLYLEKAPAAIWSGASAQPSSSSASTSAPSAAGAAPDFPLVRAPTFAGAAPAADDESATAPGATLFIKNLNFATTTPRLRAAFDQLPDFTFARVQTKPDPSRAGQTLSMGFGFVGFRSTAAATAALEARQGFALDGHALEVKFAQRNTERSGGEKGKGEGKGGKKDETSTKLLVKNVPFEATRAELRQLFGAYGTLKSVRLPRKMDNKTRGFAFLEFATRRDAEAAFGALEHTHLLGRHLVLQWATQADEERAEGDGRVLLKRTGMKRKFVME